VIVKIWLHVSKKEQARRLARREADLFERWRMTQEDRRARSRKAYLRAAEEMFELTSTGPAPWHLVEADDSSWRRVRVMTVVLDALLGALARRERPAPAVAASARENGVDPELRESARSIAVQGPPSMLDHVDLSKKLDRAEYERRLDPLQKELRDLGLECYRRRIPTVVVYEGWDAAGKGGNIKRLTQEIDPRGYEVVPIAAPDTIEKSKHYLWRFWRSLPRHGHLAIYDRSWYGRVLVERVEGFASEAEWRRAYEEINGFERHLVEYGTVLVKLWLHLSPEEQLRRFEEREVTSYKMYKITPEDWRNRLKWNEYRAAVSEMLERTSTTRAPWTVVEAEDKLWARIRALETVVSAVERRLSR
jgi:polyphosphate:AMP phosphotransferase